MFPNTLRLHIPARTNFVAILSVVFSVLAGIGRLDFRSVRASDSGTRDSALLWLVRNASRSILGVATASVSVSNAVGSG